MTTLPEGPTRVTRWTLAAGLTIIALLLYHPWVGRPFSIIDFSEFLHLLKAEGGPFARLGRLVHLYSGQQGRLNLVAYAGLVLKWELFGDHTAWWFWTRALEMAALVTMVYALFRRLDVTTIGAFAGASLFVVSRLSGEAWVRLTMGEPLGIVLMLGAMLLATRWREDPATRRGALIALLVVASVLSKEMLVGLTPLVWAIGALRGPEGRFGAPIDRRTARPLLGWVGAATILSFGACAVTALQARGEGFATLYGSVTPSVGSFVEQWQRPWQIQGQVGAPWSWLLPANTLLLLLSLAGLGLAWWRGGAERKHALWVAGGAVGLGAAYATLYLPWPYTFQYYAMPFLLGPALLFAVAMSNIERYAPRARSVALLGWLGLLAAAATSTARVTHAMIALEQVNGDLTRAIAATPRYDSLVVARLQVGRYSWIGTAPSLRAYILAEGLADSTPPAVDRTCGKVDHMVSQDPKGVLVVSYLEGCGDLPTATARFHRGSPYIWVAWNGIGAAVDSVGADLIAPR